MTSCIYNGTVIHKRFKPKIHFFKYKVFSLLIDLSELEKLDKTITESKLVINKATKNQFIEYRKVQGFELSGLGVVLHAVEHFSYHVGQIAFWVKQLTKSDLGFYDDRNLNEK